MGHFSPKNGIADPHNSKTGSKNFLKILVKGANR